MTDLNTLLPPNSGWVLTEADGINDSQQIVGQGTINGQHHAYRWQIGTGMPTDLGTLPGGANSGAKAVNKSGQVAGWSNVPPPNQDRAVLWSSAGLPADLGALPNDYWSTANALNNASQVQVVGTSEGNLDHPGHAVLWQYDSVIDLNSQLPKKSDWSLLESAYGVNDAGQIVGQGELASGPIWHAFLLTPSTGGKPSTAAALSARAVPQMLSVSQAMPLLAQVLHRWQAAGVDTLTLGNIPIHLANRGGTLDIAAGPTLYRDDHAAGWGRFVTRRSGDDSEFTTLANPGKQPSRDLLIVLVHEIGAA
jgi:probable HAF family extracellular repeat protein